MQMRTRLKKMDKRILAASLKVCPMVFYLIKVPYWYMLRIIINYWAKKGLHSITIGEFTGGTEKTRSSYREEMLLKTMLLYINIKNKSCLDLACNDGFWSFRLARFGLKSVTGIDASKKSISTRSFLK